MKCNVCFFSFIAAYVSKEIITIPNVAYISKRGSAADVVVNSYSIHLDYNYWMLSFLFILWLFEWIITSIIVKGKSVIKLTYGRCFCVWTQHLKPYEQCFSMSSDNDKNSHLTLKKNSYKCHYTSSKYSRQY